MHFLFLRTILETVFNTKNTTVNNVGFLVGLTVIAGLVVFSILSAIFGGFFAFIIVAGVTGFFAFRTSATNQELPVTDREGEDRAY